MDWKYLPPDIVQFRNFAFEFLLQGHQISKVLKKSRYFFLYIDLSIWERHEVVHYGIGSRKNV